MTARTWIDVPLTFGVTYLDGLLGDVSRNSIYMLLEAGEIRATKVGSKWIITRDAVMEWLGLNPTETPPGETMGDPVLGSVVHLPAAQSGGEL